MGKKYVVESDFDDLHGNADEPADLDVDLSDSENPIIKAALSGEDDDWTPPEDDDKDEDEDEATDDDEGEDEDDVDGDEDEDEDSEQDSDEDGDEDEDEDESEDDEEEDDDEKYSKKVRARIEREREARRRDNESSNRRIAKLEKKGELRDARDDFKATKQESESKLRKLRKQKIEALDEGDATETVVDIDDQILDIKADLKAKELELKQRETDLESDDDVDTSSGTPEVGRKFLAKYPQFHTNKRFRDVLLLTDKAVAARNFDKNTQEYYDEIEDILRPQFPKIVKKKSVRVTNKRKKPKRKRSAVGSTTRAGTRRTGSKRRRGSVVRLTKGDQQQMKIFGMDPTNPTDVKAWADSKGS